MPPSLRPWFRSTLLPLSIAATLPCVTARAQSATLLADTAVTTAHPATNYGTLSNLYISSTSTALLRFDLGTLPQNATAGQVSRATLRVFANRVNTPGVVTVAPVNADWAEAAVTSQTLPPLGAAVEVFPVTDEGQYITVDVTALVKAWLTSPKANFGLALSAASADVVFDSKENDTTAHPAQLEIAMSLSSGSIGATGPQGPKGDTGPVGPQGLAGPQGPRGDTGPQGPAGAGGTGFSFAGAYTSTASYAANQVVTWQGGAWISRHDGNQGHAPDASPTDWSILVPAPTGGGSSTTIVNGLLFEGAYASTANYAVNQVATWQNAAWVSLQDSNHGNAPDTSPTDWAVLVPAAVGLPGSQGPKGDTGAQGPQGERGLTGSQGAEGPPGATGATGKPGFSYQGAYSSTNNYAAGDVVVWQGGSWASLHDTNHGNTPDESPADWGVLSAQGLQGTAGATGPQGPIGPQGPVGEFGPAGAQGLTGPVGSTGPQGSPGRAGAQGSQGEIGPVGPQGIPGPSGLTFQGDYISGANYARNDAVTWQGQTWLSLHDSNHSNTPGQSPADWTLLAAQGATGPQGPTGPQGLQGLQGPQGSAGPQGPHGEKGDAGIIGQQGAVGMQYRGAYDSITNYALHDAVTYAGGTWISLQDANHGNAPAAFPEWWQQIAAPGVAGSTGPQGVQGIAGPNGATGSQGPPGPAGPQGAPVTFRGPWSAITLYRTGDAVFYNGSSYIATSPVDGNPPGIAPAWSLLAKIGDSGPTGAPGPQGLPGQSGSTGAAGAQGPQGPAGLRWLGVYNPATAYVTGDAVAYQGGSYVTIAEPNHGNVPGEAPQWATLAAPGAAGLNGAQGAPGTAGRDGAAATIQIGSVLTTAPGSAAAVQNIGTASAAILNLSLPQGAAGTPGTAGLTYRGTWSPNTGYAKNDAVYRNGSSYISQHDANPTDPLVSIADNTGDWALLASQGDPGPATVTLGTVASGSVPAITNTGTANAAVLNFTLPRGDTGTIGPAGLNFLGPWSSLIAYKATDAVSYLGSTYIALAGNTGIAPAGAAGSPIVWAMLAAQGNTGPAGPTGPKGDTGATPTIAIAPTLTGAPGTAAFVQNLGTADAVRFQFTIPQGATGASGTSGSGGGGGSFFSTVHTVAPMNAGKQDYNPLVDGHGAGDLFAVLAYLPATCNLATVQIYNSATTDTAFEIHTGTPGSMNHITEACIAKANTSTTCNGPGVLGSSNFVDFAMTSSGALTGFVYTQFTCN